MKFVKETITNFFSKGHARSINARKQILWSFLLRGLSILAGFILVPLTLDYLGGGETANTKYGVWLTLSSLINWIGYFDIGIGSGLRNKFAESLAKNDKKSARIYVSTAYALFSMLFGGILIVFLVANPYIHWEKLLGITEIKDVNLIPELITEINNLVYYVIVFLIIRLVLGLISVLLKATQKPAVSNSVFPIAQILSLIALYIIARFSHGSLVYIGIIMSIMPLLVYLFYTIYYYNKDFKWYKPSLKYVKLSYSKSLFSLGVQFFFIQMALIVILQTDNLIISKIPELGPKEVTPYNIAFKYFSIATVAFTTIIAPYWSAFTEAYTKLEFNWIRKTIRDLFKIWIFISLGIVVMIFISNWFYNFWLDGRVSVPFNLSVFFGLFIIISNFTNIFTYFINGTGKIRLQLYAYIFGAIINIPLSIFFAKNLGMGTTGVIIGTCCSLLPVTLIMPFQYKKIIKGKETGIWSK